MHERSLTSGLLHTIETLGAEHHAVRAVAVDVVIGALANISPDHFREHFEESARGTIAQGASLRIREDDDVQSDQALHVVLESVEFEQ
jgi:hydrogenase nickel incorporation protein HypA/HybF